MGGVVRAAVGVIGVAAIFIPGVGPIISGTVASVLGASAGAAALSFAVGQGIALASPVADLEPIDSGGFGPIGRANYRAFQSGAMAEAMSPIRSKWHLNRWRLFRALGDCMVPRVLPGQYMMLDRKNVIRRGDLITFKTPSGSLTKRFVGVENDYLIVETTNPGQTYSVPLAKVKWAYRVRLIALDKAAAWSAVFAVAKDEMAHNERLGRISAVGGGNVLTEDRRAV